MRRLTVHLKNVETVTHKGKQKSFNTLAFRIKTDREAQIILSGMNKDNIIKHYFSNIN